MTQSQVETDAFDTVQGFKACKEQTDVYSIFLKYIGNFGFDSFILSGMPPVGFRLEPHIVMQNWPLEWYRLYISKSYYDHDPVVRHLESDMQPHLWSDIVYSRELTDRQRQVMNDATEFGLHDGYIIPLEGTTDLQNCLSLSGQHLELPPYSHDAIYMVAMYAHETIIRIDEETEKQTQHDESQLTPREREILSWVANGKTDPEIGIICGISHRTASDHVKNAIGKLGAVNRTQAVVEAIKAGQISP